VIVGSEWPLFLCTAGFLATFVITRIVVRAIRAGRGPLSDNVVGGVHVHHAVPGIVLMTVFGLLALAADSTGWRSVAGLGFGVGLALVLDEFALILHLDDVYWSEEGRTSVNLVFLTAGVLALVLLGATPGDVSGEDGSAATGVVVILAVVTDLAMSVLCLAKGKLATAVIGVLVPVVAFVGAIRLARPRSPWARRRYPPGSRKASRAEARETRFDQRWRHRVQRVQDWVAGTLSTEP